MTDTSMRAQILGSGITRTALRLSWPMMLSNGFQTVYNLTDALWLGRLGPEAIAAPSISWPIIFLFISMSAGLGMAGTTLVAQYTGAGDRSQTNRVAGQLVLILLVTSTIVAGAGYVFVDSVLQLMNIPENVFAVTANYLRISFLGLPFMFLHFGFQSLLRGYGDTRTPMILSVVSAISDMALDPFFIFGWLGLPAMGAEGAAITTVLTRGAAGLFGLYLLFSGRLGIKITTRHLHPDLPLMKHILTIGVPSALGLSSTALGFTVLTSLVAIEDGVLGGSGLLLSAYGIGNRISSIVNIIIFSGASAVTTMVGQNLGANQLNRAWMIVKQLFLTFTAIAIVESLIVYLLRVPMYQAFVDDASVIAFGAHYMAFFVPFIPGFAVFRLINSVFDAAGKTRISMLLSIIRLWGMRVVFAYVLYSIAGMGATGIWLGLSIGNGTAALLAVILLFRVNWRQRVI